MTTDADALKCPGCGATLTYPPGSGMSNCGACGALVVGARGGVSPMVERGAGGRGGAGQTLVISDMYFPPDLRIEASDAHTRAERLAQLERENNELRRRNEELERLLRQMHTRVHILQDQVDGMEGAEDG